MRAFRDPSEEPASSARGTFSVLRALPLVLLVQPGLAADPSKNNAGTSSTRVSTDSALAQPMPGESAASELTAPPLPVQSASDKAGEPPGLVDADGSATSELTGEFASEAEPPQKLLQYEFDTALAAAPPDLTLANASPFAFSPGPSALGPGVHPFFNVGVVYDDNIFLDEDNEESDVILSATAGVQAEFGNEERAVAIGYAISGYLFIDHSDESALNHDAWINAHRRFSKTNVSGAARFQRLSGSDRDVGGYTERDSATASVLVTHELTGKTRLRGGVEHTTLLYDAFNDSYDTIGRLGFDYEVSTKTRVGMEGALGYLAADNGSDQTYEQANATLNYDVTGKLTTVASAGWEWRQWDGDGGDDNYPVYSLGLNWRPREATSIWLRGASRTFASALYDNVTRRSNNIELSLTQQIRSQFALSLATGYDHSDYDGPGRAEGAGREDDYFYVRPSLSFGITPRISSSLFYEYRNNDSNEGRAFSGNRVGSQLGYTF